MKLPSDYVKAGWTQGTSARDKNGIPVDPCSPEATCWCLIGAVNAAYNDCEANFEAQAKLYLSLENVTFFNVSISTWNDNHDRTQQEAVNILEQVGL